FQVFLIFGCEKTFLRLNCCQKAGPRRASVAEKQLFNLPARFFHGSRLNRGLKTAKKIFELFIFSFLMFV
ncbi:MAG: hypothetical protein ABSD42_14695, partial [Candidatus Bathyarchaeia archaeon]